MQSISDKTRLLLGPPGTGKTTTLLNTVSEALAKGVEPEQIAFIAFTRKASNEAKERAVRQFGFDEERLPYFRTLHSLCFRLLGLDHKQLMRPKDYMAIGDILGLDVQCKQSWEDHTTTWGGAEGDRLLFLEQLTRMRMCDLRETYDNESSYNVSFDSLKILEKALKEYKKDKDLYDYNDLLAIFAVEGQAPHFRLLIIDEAQDLSALQWKAVERLAQTSEVVWVAGDDDQAIFRWAGADIEKFILLPTIETRVLQQSYRVPSRIAAIANGQIAQVSNRREKSWNPRDTEGYVGYDIDLDNVDFDCPGSWLILARNQYLLQSIQSRCINEGLLYESAVDCLVNSETGVAIRAWNKLLDGAYCTVTEALTAYDLMFSKEGYAYGSRASLAKLDPNKPVNLSQLVSVYGLKTTRPWYESLSRISPVELHYFKTLQARNKLDSKPNIKLSTIHGAKGGEADHVLLVTDMATVAYESMSSGNEDERRVWYVGITRAKQSLGLIKPKTNQHVNL
jgi:DNA helicase-2/ATP-dependent DNA helicase PcrA